MLLKGRGISVSQEAIRDIIGEPSDVDRLSRALNQFDKSDDEFVWRGIATTNESLENIFRHHKRGFSKSLGRRGNNAMVSRNKVEFLDLKEKANGRFDLILKIENETKHFDVDIIDRDGIFGIDFPSELYVILREFLILPKEIVNAVRPVYAELVSNQLQVA